MDIIASTESLRYAHSKSSKPKYNEFSNHIHNQYEILYFLSGNAKYIVGNTHHLLKRGDIVLIPPMINHYVQIIEDSEYERTVINFKNCDVRKELLQKLFATPKIFTVANNKMISELFSRFEYFRLYFDNEDRNLLFNNLLTELIYLLSNLSYEHFKFLESDKGNSTLQGAIKYIENNLLEIKNIESICKALFISRSYLHKLFLESLGASPMKYIKTKRLILAHEMIQIGEKPSNIYLKLGFSDYTAFFRAYKSFFGYSPTKTLPLKN